MKRLKSLITRGIFAALAVMLIGSAASAETLMMPKRDALMGQQLVVWGVTTQAAGAVTLDFGDGTPNAVGTIGPLDRSYLAFTHTYATPGLKTATLTVGAESATVEIQVFDGASLPADSLRSLRVNNAIQDGLRFLWTSQSNRAGNFPAGGTTNWGGGFPGADASLIVAGFENHGYKLSGSAAPTGLYEKYIVRRGLNFIFSTLFQQGLGVQTAGNPCVGSGPAVGTAAAWNGSDCIGISAPGDPGYATAVAVIAIAASGTPNRIQTEVGGVTNNKTYGEIIQRLVNAEAWGQSDAHCGAGRGGFGYQHNGCQFDGSTAGWAVLGFLDGEASGATIPTFVRTEYAVGLAHMINNDGSFDYCPDGSPASQCAPGPAKVGIGLQSLYFVGESSARINTVANNISSWWQGSGIGGLNWGCSVSGGGAGTSQANKGCAYAMFNNFKGLKLQGIATLPGVPRGAGPGSIPANDWYADYQDWFLANQNAPTTPFGGQWPAMGFSCCYGNPQTLTAGIAELILSPVALVLPDEDKFSTVGLSPATHTAIEGGTHTVTAKAESTSGAPVPGATVNFTILSGPNAGLTGVDTTDSNGEATFTYTDAGPDGTTGTDKIQAKIGVLESNIVDMIWVPKNTPPVAVDDAYSTPEDTALSGDVTDNDTDADGDTLTVSLVSGTSNGSLVLNPDGTFTYTPNANFNGSDSFTYKVNDGKVDGNTATVTITVTPVNDPPVAQNDAATTSEDTPVSGNVLSNDSDVDGDTLQASLVSGPSHGLVVLNADGSYTYTPALNYNGPDSFTYQVSDGHGGVATAVVSITVTPVNDAPTCEVEPSIKLLWPPNHKLVPITLSGFADVDGDTVTATVNAIAQDEPTNTQGDGNTSSDAAGIGSSVAQVRAERAGSPKVPGNGRVYYISFTGSDGNGGSCTGTVQVGVPHDQGQRSVPIGDGPRYNSVTGAPLP